MQNGESSGEGNASWHASLALVEVFRDLPEAQLAELERQLVTLPIRRGEVLVRQGDPEDALYIVGSGRFAVDVGDRRIAEIGIGAPIGEIAFFADRKRTATVTALRDSIVFKLSHADFIALVDRYPAILKPIAVTLARRLADTLATDAEPHLSHPRTIAVVPAGRMPLDETFRDEITKALSSFGQIAIVDSAMLHATFPDDPEFTSEAVTSWLNRQEARFHFVLYFTDPNLTAFNRKAIRQADQILLVGLHRECADGAPQLNPSERFAFEIHPVSAFRLVLLHEARAPISGTSRWLEQRPVSRHHIVIGDKADYDRIARFLTGHALGFVAAGGGALCAAHIGVYKALLEAGLSFDLVGGTSGGGAMTAAFALGASPDDVSTRTADIFLTSRALKRLTWPRYSLLDHTVFDRALKTHYGETDIEDLWTSYFSVATCLVTNSLRLITRGPVWKAVRATSSIPGLLPPVYEEDNILVDGSLLDNVPVKSMRTLKSGPNIVVNLRPEGIKGAGVDYTALPSRRQLMWQLLNPFRRRYLPKAPGVATVLLRSMMVRRERLADSLRSEDLLLTPPLPDDVGVMDWHRHAELTAGAYDYTAKVIEGLRESGHPLFR